MYSTGGRDSELTKASSSRLEIPTILGSNNEDQWRGRR